MERYYLRVDMLYLYLSGVLNLVDTQGVHKLFFDIESKSSKQLTFSPWRDHNKSESRLPVSRRIGFQVGQTPRRAFHTLKVTRFGRPLGLSISGLSFAPQQCQPVGVVL